MKLKYYLRGIGTGILFTLCFMALTGGNKKEKMSDSEIIHAAKSLGMVEADSTVKINGISPTVVPSTVITPLPTATLTPTVTPEPTEITESTITPGLSVTPEPTVTPSPTVTPTPVPTALPSPTVTPSQETDHIQTISFTIRKGMYSDAVAQEAYRIGLVDNAHEFDKYLIDSGYASFIRIGTFSIQQGASYSEIASAITGK